MPESSPVDVPLRMLSVRLPAALLERLDGARWALRRNKSAMVRQAIEAYLDRALPQPVPAPVAGAYVTNTTGPNVLRRFGDQNDDA